MYQCHNQPRPTHDDVQWVQDGWTHHRDMAHMVIARQPVMVPIKFTMSTTCQYDKSDKDYRCACCQFKKEKQDGKS